MEGFNQTKEKQKENEEKKQKENPEGTQTSIVTVEGGDPGVSNKGPANKAQPGTFSRACRKGGKASSRAFEQSRRGRGKVKKRWGRHSAGNKKWVPQPGHHPGAVGTGIGREKNKEKESLNFERRWGGHPAED